MQGVLQQILRCNVTMGLWRTAEPRFAWMWHRGHHALCVASDLYWIPQVKNRWESGKPKEETIHNHTQFHILGMSSTFLNLCCSRSFSGCVGHVRDHFSPWFFGEQLDQFSGLSYHGWIFVEACMTWWQRPCKRNIYRQIVKQCKT